MEQDTGQDRLVITTHEAAERLGLASQTLRLWRSDGKGPRYIRLGNRIRYRVEDLEAWIESQAETPGS